MKKLFLTANAFQRDCARLAKKIFDDPHWHPELLLALWRGGAQPGVIMSEVFSLLGRPTPHAIISCSSYKGVAQRNSEVLFHNAEDVLNAIRPGQKVLVVDDVFDSGHTAKAVKERLPQADLRIATVYWKPKANLVGFAPDYFLRETEEWIVFPHEISTLTPDELRTKDPELADILF